MPDSSDEQPAVQVTRHQHARKGDKGTDAWTKSSTVIWRLLEAIGIILMAVFGAVYASTLTTKETVAVHDGDLKVIKSKIEQHDATFSEVKKDVTDVNRKIDLILIHHGIQDTKK